MIKSASSAIQSATREAVCFAQTSCKRLEDLRNFQLRQVLIDFITLGEFTFDTSCEYQYNSYQVHKTKYTEWESDGNGGRRPKTKTQYNRIFNKTVYGEKENAGNLIECLNTTTTTTSERVKLPLGRSQLSDFICQYTLSLPPEKNILSKVILSSHFVDKLGIREGNIHSLCKVTGTGNNEYFSRSLNEYLPARPGKGSIADIKDLYDQSKKKIINLIHEDVKSYDQQGDEQAEYRFKTSIRRRDPYVMHMIPIHVSTFELGDNYILTATPLVEGSDQSYIIDDSVKRNTSRTKPIFFNKQLRPLINYLSISTAALFAELVAYELIGLTVYPTTWAYIIGAILFTSYWVACAYAAYVRDRIARISLTSNYADTPPISSSSPIASRIDTRIFEDSQISRELKNAESRLTIDLNKNIFLAARILSITLPVLLIMIDIRYLLK